MTTHLIVKTWAMKPNLKGRALCTQKKESNEMTGHEAREDMKEKKKKDV